MKSPTSILIAMFLSLFACLALADPSPSGNSESASGIEGMISVSPVQGGPARQGVSDARPLGNTVFVVKQGETTVTSFTTDDQGRFQISLAPGHYAISMKDWKGVMGYFGPFEVEVVMGQMKKVRWSCDTGIR